MQIGLEANMETYEQDKKIQGFVGMMDDYLPGIFVDKKCRSMGTGKALLECVKENYKSDHSSGRIRYPHAGSVCTRILEGTGGSDQRNLPFCI